MFAPRRIIFIRGSDESRRGGPISIRIDRPYLRVVYRYLRIGSSIVILVFMIDVKRVARVVYNGTETFAISDRSHVFATRSPKFFRRVRRGDPYGSRPVRARRLLATVGRDGRPDPGARPVPNRDTIRIRSTCLYTISVLRKPSAAFRFSTIRWRPSSRELNPFARAFVAVGPNGNKTEIKGRERKGRLARFASRWGSQFFGTSHVPRESRPGVRGARSPPVGMRKIRRARNARN